MRVWVNVWGTATLRYFVAAAFAPLLFGCIDDFDDPKGYGPRDGSSDTFGEQGLTCTELCAKSEACGGGDELDCREQCDELSRVSRRAGCTENLGKVLDCLAELRNVCTQQEDCSQLTFHFSSCIESYCQTHPSDCPF